MVQATSTCGHPLAQYLCQRCQTEFCPQCLEDHAKFIGEVSSRLAGQLGAKLAGPVPTWDEKSAAFCPKCVAEFSQMQVVGRTIIATMNQEASRPRGLTVGQFLDMCANRDLLPADLLASLRVESGAHVHSNDVRTLSRWLVKHDHLTRYQAQKLLNTDPSSIAEKAKPARRADAVAEKAAKEAPAPDKTADKALWDELPALGATPGAANLDELTAMAGQSVGLAPMLPGARGPVKKLAPTNVWDSKLLLIGGGFLLVFVIGGAALLWSLTRGSGDEAFQQANADYNGGLYTQAINKYSKYLERYPTHKDASLARVRRGLAQMRQAMEGKSDYSGAIVEAKKVLEEIRTEEKFPEARADLSEMLPDMAKGLAEQAYEKQDGILLAKAREALALSANPNYVAKQFLNEETIRTTEQRLAQVEHNLNRDAALQAAIAQIEQFIQAGDTAKAYARRKELLKQYPELLNNEQLFATVAKASQAEQAAVKFKPADVAAETTEAATPIESSVPLASPSGSSAPGVEGRVLSVIAEGAAYGLEATSGKILWRRFVGMDVPCPAVPVSKIVGSDLLLVDAARQELLRVAAATGQLKWRQKIAGGVASAPLALRQKILVPTHANSLLVLNADDGRLLGAFEFTQKVRTPAVDPSERVAFLAGHHSNLYALSLETGKCTGVVYLGHEAGAVRVPPALVESYVVLAENIGTKYTQLRVFQVDEKETRPVQSMRLDGQLHAAPTLQGRQLLIATDLGAAYVFEISPGAEKPLNQSAAKPASLPAPIAPFTLRRDDYLWYADKQIVCYRIQVNTGKLVPQWAKEPGDTFVQPLDAAGDVLFHVRRRAGIRGVTVCAAKIADGEHFWEMHLSAPAVSGLLVDPSTKDIAALTAAGSLYKVSYSQLQARRVPEQPYAALPEGSPRVAQLQEPLHNGGQVTGGAAALTSPGQSEALLVDARLEAEFAMRWLPLPDRSACAPIAYLGRLLVPGVIGQVYCVDAESGHSALGPFQPKVSGGDEFHWLGPLSAPEDDMLLSDGAKRLYRLGLRKQPVDHLAALDEAELPSRLVSPLARVGSTAFAVDDSGKLLGITLPGLAVANTWDLGTGVAWGPRRVGDVVLLASDDNRLFCLDEVEKTENNNPVKVPNLRWTVPLKYGPLSGDPLSGDPLGGGNVGGAGAAGATSSGMLVLSSLGGTLWTVALKDGKEISAWQLGEPLGQGPVAMEDRFLLLGHDGTLHLVPQTQAKVR